MNGSAPGKAERRLLDLVEEQARQKQVPDGQIAKLVENAQASLRKAAARTGQPLEAVAHQALERTEHRLAERSRPPAERRLEDAFRKMLPEEQCRRFFTDQNTGLFNQRGLEALPPPAGRPVLAEWDIEATKFINDQHGHEALDGALRAAARALGREIPDGAKIGGSLRGYVRDQGEATRIAAAIEKALDPSRRIRVTAAVAPREATIAATIAKTAEAHGEVKKLERATGRLGYRLGGPVAFMHGAPPIAFEEGMDGADPKSPKAKEFFAKAAARTAPLVDKLKQARPLENIGLTPAHAQRFAQLSPREQAESMFLESTTGLLTEQGFRALPERRWKASVDMRALRDLDHALGHADADKVIATFGRAIAKVVGPRFDAAHLHGDEYVLQSDSEKALTKALGAIEAECARLAFLKQLPDRRLVSVKGVEFAWGIGKTYEEADRVDLALRKELLPEARKPTLVPTSRAGAVLVEMKARGAFDVREELPPRVHGLALTGLDAHASAPKSRGMER